MKVYYICTLYREVEQQVARWAHNPKVAGSSPALATKIIKRLYYCIVNRFFNFIKKMQFYSNPIYVLIMLSLMVILSVYAGKSKIGTKLGGPALLVIIFTAIIANF